VYGCLFIFVQLIQRALQALWAWLNAYVAFGLQAIYRSWIARNGISAVAAGAEEGIVPVFIGTLSSIVTGIILAAFLVALLAVTVGPLLQFNKVSTDSNKAAAAARSKLFGAGGSYPGMQSPASAPNAEDRKKQKELLDSSSGAGTVGGAGPIDDLPPSGDSDPNWEITLKIERANFQAGQDFSAMITKQKEIYKRRGVDPCQSIFFPKEYCK
jgi:hypothetical protein